jgi:ABC-type transport system involved in multi-copper enzyme maturation permease subunit
MSTPSTTSDRKDTGAVLALVLAFVVPPLGAVLGMTGRGGRSLSGLRLAAVGIGTVLTVFAVLVLIMVFAGTNATEQGR